MRAEASVLHLDLDAFYASVEQRDKPSLRTKPVIVGGSGARGVVATASYEARKLGVHSAMSGAHARKLAPHAAFLAGRFNAYRQSSKIVLALLSQLSPIVEPLSLDEAYVDLAAGSMASYSQEALENLVTELRAELYKRTEGLNASVGVGTSKFMAKLGSEANKPNGYKIIMPGQELELITSMKVEAIPGVGPATKTRLNRLGIYTVADLQQASAKELIRELGQAAGAGLHQLAFARDDRQILAAREAKSISVEDTFDIDLVDANQIKAILESDSRTVAARLIKAGVFAKTISVKARLADFTTFTRSRTIEGATDSAEIINQIATELITALDLREGVRLLGLGTSNFTGAAQEQLFVAANPDSSFNDQTVIVPNRRFNRDLWLTGADVMHDDYGRGWVWGSGLNLVTVRFEDRTTKPGPVKTFAANDKKLKPADLLEMAWDKTS